MKVKEPQDIPVIDVTGKLGRAFTIFGVDRARIFRSDVAHDKKPDSAEPGESSSDKNDRGTRKPET